VIGRLGESLSGNWDIRWQDRATLSNGPLEARTPEARDGAQWAALGHSAAATAAANDFDAVIDRAPVRLITTRQHRHSIGLGCAQSRPKSVGECSLSQVERLTKVRQ
jgi:hypothetical protein